ncbi:hypothetical protein P389DRAFT_211335 [Cystobasidium minutum MCA 4210]|uniref:uncharacterized protein n=1 Tax=Cystobasidium minutum MCA 4210 TaxID=1397322 RepID=UPI0034CDA4D1|eukprot:jgi/Rhomi1/211335/estExt_Genemark1.C_4_t30001
MSHFRPNRPGRTDERRPGRYDPNEYKYVYHEKNEDKPLLPDGSANPSYRDPDIVKPLMPDGSANPSYRDQDTVKPLLPNGADNPQYRAQEHRMNSGIPVASSANVRSAAPAPPPASTFYMPNMSVGQSAAEGIGEPHRWQGGQPTMGPPVRPQDSYGYLPPALDRHPVAHHAGSPSVPSPMTSTQYSLPLQDPVSSGRERPRRDMRRYSSGGEAGFNASNLRQRVPQDHRNRRPAPLLRPIIAPSGYDTPGPLSGASSPQSSEYAASEYARSTAGSPVRAHSRCGTDASPGHPLARGRQPAYLGSPTYPARPVPRVSKSQSLTNLRPGGGPSKPSNVQQKSQPGANNDQASRRSNAPNSSRHGKLADKQVANDDKNPRRAKYRQRDSSTDEIKKRDSKSPPNLQGPNQKTEPRETRAYHGQRSSSTGSSHREQSLKGKNRSASPKDDDHKARPAAS